GCHCYIAADVIYEGSKRLCCCKGVVYIFVVVRHKAAVRLVGMPSHSVESGPRAALVHPLKHFAIPTASLARRDIIAVNENEFFVGGERVWVIRRLVYVCQSPA